MQPDHDLVVIAKGSRSRLETLLEQIERSAPLYGVDIQRASVLAPKPRTGLLGWFIAKARIRIADTVSPYSGDMP